MVTVQEAIIPKVLWIAEGVETALSVAKAMPNHTVVASLSAQQLKNVPVSGEVKKVIICADNDGANASSQKAVMKAIEYHLSKGRQVYLAMPPGPNKMDFNDLIKQGGVSAVQRTLEKMVEIREVRTLQTSSLNAIIEGTKMKSSNPVVSPEKIKTELER